MKFKISKEWCEWAAQIEEDSEVGAGVGSTIYGEEQIMATKIKNKKLAEIKKKMDDAYKEMQETGQKAFKETLVELFERYPMVEAFRWHQYTPYFNDDDTYTFGIGEPTCLVRSPDGQIIVDEDGDIIWHGDWDADLPDTVSKDTIAQLGKALSEIGECLEMDDLMETMFGNHVEVTCTRSTIETEEYNHD
jgi:hypothetical protein